MKLGSSEIQLQRTTGGIDVQKLGSSEIHRYHLDGPVAFSFATVILIKRKVEVVHACVEIVLYLCATIFATYCISAIVYRAAKEGFCCSCNQRFLGDFCPVVIGHRERNAQSAPKLTLHIRPNGERKLTVGNLCLPRFILLASTSASTAHASEQY